MAEIEQIKAQLPEITRECLHFSLEALRARHQKITGAIRPARAMIRRIQHHRATLSRVMEAGPGAYRDDLARLDLTLARHERDLEHAVDALRSAGRQPK